MSEQERDEIMEALDDYDACLQAPECTVDEQSEEQAKPSMQAPSL